MAKNTESKIRAMLGKEPKEIFMQFSREHVELQEIHERLSADPKTVRKLLRAAGFEAVSTIRPKAMR